MLLDIINPSRILFGPGSNERITAECQRLGQKPLILTGRNSLAASGNLERITASLRQSALDAVFYSEVDPEPTVDQIDEIRTLLLAQGCDLVVGVGGGSVLDAAKAAAGLIRETELTRDFLYGRTPQQPGLPWIAVPTTAGSGSEVTENAVLIDPPGRRKSSIRDSSWIAAAAIVDPIFTMSMPRNLTALSGLDALTHAIEAFSSRWSNPYSNGLSKNAVVLITQNIYASFTTGRKEPREKMMLASLLAGMALNNVRAGAVHALAHALGAQFGTPHGQACAALLPQVMRYNLPLIDHKYAELAYATSLAAADAPPEEAANRFINYIEKLLLKMELPGKLSEIGISAQDIPEIVEAAFHSSSLEANPRRTRAEDLAHILENSL